MPLLCIAGTLCDGRVFAPMLAALGEPEAVCVPVEQASVAAAVDAILAAAPERFVALGFSLGGFVAIEVACRAPERAMGLVLLSSNARADPPETAPVRRAQLARFTADGAAALIDDIWPKCVAPAHLARDKLKAALVAMAEDTPVARLAAQTDLAIARPDARAALSALHAPLLAIHGAEDAMCPPDRAVETSGLASRGSSAFIARAGHFAPLEDPDAVAEALGTWLARERLG